jgi:1-acyl-sn-glycerol-3-phosphate acyltransferase
VSWFFYLSRAVVKTVFFLFTRVQVNGRVNIPETGPLIIVPNHITFAEPQLIGILVKRKMRFAAKEEFFRLKSSKILMQSLGCFPVHQGIADRKTIHLMEQFVKEGFALVIFPEGTRSLNAELLPALNGTALIAQRTDALILPVGITGTERMQRWFWFLKRPRITVSFGKPFLLPSDEEKLAREEATKLIMEHITDLLPSKYHGVYAEK